MFELFQMWALVEVLGILCLPLTLIVCHNLPDRGWAFSKTLAVVLFAFCIWFPLMTVRVLPFNRMFIAGVALILLALGCVGLWRQRQAVLRLLQRHLLYIIVTEVIFLGMVFLLGWLRSYNPNIQSYEMFMDEGFISSIMRSPHLPPNDMWFSGYSINYYYYAHFVVAMFAKLLGQSSSIAFNTGISMFFGLTATNLFGVTSNVVAWARHLRQQKQQEHVVSEEAAQPVEDRLPSLRFAIPFGLLSMVMGLIFGNLAATQQWWQNHGEGAHYDWFGPSRVVGNTINEFPAFSFLLSCFHAHVLTLAFTILGIGLAFNLLLEKDGRGLFAFGRGWQVPATLAMTALVLGGLFTMNGWDYPTYLALAIVCIGLQHWRAYQGRINIDFLLDMFSSIVSLAALSFLFFLPFYLNFSSPSQGLGFLPVKERTPLAQELLIYGLFAFVFLSLLLASVLKRPLFERNPFALQSQQSSVNEHLTRADVAEEASWTGSDQISVPDPSTTVSGQAEQVALAGGAAVQVALQESAAEDLSEKTSNAFLFRVLGLLVVMLLIALALIFVPASGTFVVCCCIALLAVMLLFYNRGDQAHVFVLLLGGTAFALIAFCEIIFLKDAFAGGDANRMNTVFKFYFQAWSLLSIAAGAGLFFILESFRPLATFTLSVRWAQRGVFALWGLCLLGLLLASSVYPILAPYARYAQYDAQTNKIDLVHTNSLDGMTYLRTDPTGYGDYPAIRWINTHIEGDPVIIEAVGDDYSYYGRISAFTGLPTPMGWVGHEIQWRLNWINNPVNSAEFNRRGGDISEIYTNTNAQTVLSLMAHYHAQYLYVGQLEHAKFPNADLHRYSAFMQIVYNANGTIIYKVR